MNRKREGRKEGRGREEVGKGKWDFLDSALMGVGSLKPIKMTLYKWFYEFSCDNYICLWLSHTFTHI